MKDLRFDCSKVDGGFHIQDLGIEDKDLLFVSDGDELLQHLRVRLLFYFREWYLNANVGVPYHEEIFGKNGRDKGSVDMVYRREILKTEGVVELLAFESEFNRVKREYKMVFTVRTSYGILDFDSNAISSCI